MSSLHPTSHGPLIASLALVLAAGLTAVTLRTTAVASAGTVTVPPSIVGSAPFTCTSMGVAAANAGATSQDLKTGFLVGATPKYQQIGLGKATSFADATRDHDVSQNYAALLRAVGEAPALYCV